MSNNKKFKNFKGVFNAFYYGRASTKTEHEIVCSIINQAKKALFKNNLWFATCLMNRAFMFINAPVKIYESGEIYPVVY